MDRTTIDFGIDLGTTNSAVSVLKKNGKVEVIKNNIGSELTPSAVWINKRGNLYTGIRAKEYIEIDPDNAYAEFKLQMGTDTEFTFNKSGRSMNAEELSAEILKSLKTDVKQMIGEDINAVVITVPAAFEFPQIDATNKAAKLAGFSHSPLLQEPIAAALAYGFQSQSDKVFWLVYDFGGGTFDAAVMHVKDGGIHVVNHMGDNHLGGKLIDWEIVDKLFTPELLDKYDLSDFKRGNSKWRIAFAKLKKAAEEAKIRLSRADSEEILITGLGQDDSGEEMELDFVLKRKAVEPLIKPLVIRSINLCKKALSEKHLSSEHIEKVVLVGGTTLIPYVREILADPKEGLGIPQEYSINPLTVVAQGAAIFASSQRLQIDIRNISSHQYALELDYESVGTEKVFDVAGKITHSTKMDFSGFTIEFIGQDKEKSRSGKIPISAKGTFFTELQATEESKNSFQIELCNPEGILQETVPKSISYTFGMTIDSTLLVHSIGVGLANNEVRFFFDKGDRLPQRKTETFRTAYEAKSGEEKPVIKVPIIEGENRQRADRNMLIGYLNIPGNAIRRVLPAGSEVEVTIDVNESQIISTAAFIPELGIVIEEVIKLKKETQDTKKQKEDFESQKQRLNKIKEKAEMTDDSNLLKSLGQIEKEDMMQELENALATGGQDKDSPDKIQKSLNKLKQVIDDIEEKTKWPLLLEEVEEEREMTRKVVNEYGSNEDKHHFQVIDGEIRQYITKEIKSMDDLNKKLDELRSLRISILQEQPGYWVGLFQHLNENRQMFTDQHKASPLFTKGEAAIKKNSVIELKEVIRALFELLPIEQQQAMPGGLESTII